MMNEDKPKLALRVYKRTSKHLILLWRRTEGVDPTQARVVYQEIPEKGRGREVEVPGQHIHIDEPVEGADAKGFDDQTVICMIKEREAGLDPDATYYVTVHYGPDKEGKRVTPAGVFPSHEREDRNKNVHLMGWHDESQTWRKVGVVKGPDNRYYLGTICVGCQEHSH